MNPYVQNRFGYGWYDELFYWSIDMPLLPIKGAQVIKRFLQTNNDPKFYQTKHNIHGYNKQLGMYLTLDAVKILLYPKWNNSIFCNGKASSMLFSERDDWFFRSNLNQNNKYEQMIYSLIKRVGSDWYKQKDLVFHQTPKYYLE